MAEMIAGSCLCEAVKFEYEAPSKWCAHCHCSMCRRAHGAPYVTWVGVEEGRFRFTAGDAERTTYASSENGRRTFCNVCGSQLVFQSSQWPGEVHIARALFPGAIDRLPQVNAFTDGHADWVQLPDLPKLDSAGG